MVVDHCWPDICGFVSKRCEVTNHNIWSLSLNSLDGDIFRLAYRLRGSAPGNQYSAASRRFDGLVVHLLVVDDVFIVEFNIFGIKLVLQTFVDWVGWLGILRGAATRRHLDVEEW